MGAFEQYTDKLLLELVRQDHVEAFELLYERYWNQLYQSAFYLLRDSAASKDIVQDVFVWIWEHRSKLDINNVKTYLKAAIRFKAANQIRSGNIREGVFEHLAQFPQNNPYPDANELVEVKELERVIDETIGRLPQKCREVYRLSHQEWLSNREIAGRLGISVKTVENQMTIALKRLRSGVTSHFAIN